MKKSVVHGFAQNGEAIALTSKNKTRAALRAASQSPEQWVIFAAKAANAAMLKSAAANARLEEGEEDVEWQNEADRRAEAKVAFMANMPLLTSRRNAQAYIACVAAGVSMTVLTAEEGAKLMYIAQNALAAYKVGK